jgi:hypothetical protein
MYLRIHLIVERFVFWAWWSWSSERESQDLSNDTNVASWLANFSSVFIMIVYVRESRFKKKWVKAFKFYLGRVIRAHMMRGGTWGKGAQERRAVFLGNPSISRNKTTGISPYLSQASQRRGGGSERAEGGFTLIRFHFLRSVVAGGRDMPPARTIINEIHHMLTNIEMKHTLMFGRTSQQSCTYTSCLREINGCMDSFGKDSLTTVRVFDSTNGVFDVFLFFLLLLLFDF